MGDGWTVLPGGRIADGEEPPLHIDLLLLHPTRGVVLLERAPRWTPLAPSRFFHALDRLGFRRACPGYLPLVHLPLRPEAAEALPRLMAERLRGQPPLSLRCPPERWMALVRQAVVAPRTGARRRRLALGGVAAAALAALAALWHGPGQRPPPAEPPLRLAARAGAEPPILMTAAARLAAMPEAEAPPLPAPGALPGIAAAGAALSEGPQRAGETPPPPGVDPAVTEALLRRGEALLALGDISAARRFFERAAAVGSAEAALAAGGTYDPAILRGLDARGILPDPALAAAWYRRAAALGAAEAEARLAALAAGNPP
ncbi:hypothetical protein [Crenalkalicoccus roseus]|uniref:hypothetical protein n=1 Tax=Crenalkalicoccus roseus TaxID=1485588 RepID=UPI0010808DDA|nr:hypothetical protein [Crenalkalicoccus roseus]